MLFTFLKKGLLRLLGSVNFYHRFIPHATQSQALALASTARKKDCPLIWDQDSKTPMKLSKSANRRWLTRSRQFIQDRTLRQIKHRRIQHGNRRGPRTIYERYLETVGIFFTQNSTLANSLQHLKLGNTRSLQDR